MSEPSTPARADLVPGLVSVVTASYNCGKYIGAAIESILAQSYPQLELHVVDDGSTDDTESVVQRYLGDGRVHYYRQANAGQTRAKNRAIEESAGEYIAFCDADDLWPSDKLAIQVPHFTKRDRIGVVYGRISSISESGTPIGAGGPPPSVYRSGRVTEDLFKTNIVPFGSAIVRHACLREMGAFDERYRMGIDWELWLRLSTRYEFEFVDAETYVYRVWSGQMSTNWKGRYEHAFRIMEDFLTRYPGLVSPEVVREAWANSFAQRARLRARDSAEYGAALADLTRALTWKPMYGLAWRSIAYVGLKALGVRE